MCGQRAHRSPIDPQIAGRWLRKRASGNPQAREASPDFAPHPASNQVAGPLRWLTDGWPRLTKSSITRQPSTSGRAGEACARVIGQSPAPHGDRAIEPGLSPQTSRPAGLSPAPVASQFAHLGRLPAGVDSPSCVLPRQPRSRMCALLNQTTIPSRQAGGMQRSRGVLVAGVVPHSGSGSPGRRKPWVGRHLAGVSRSWASTG